MYSIIKKFMLSIYAKVLAKIYKVWYKIYRKSNKERKEVFNCEKL